jgi:hypothetical protein
MIMNILAPWSALSLILELFVVPGWSKVWRYSTCVEELV